MVAILDLYVPNALDNTQQRLWEQDWSRLGMNLTLDLHENTANLSHLLYFLPTNQKTVVNHDKAYSILFHSQIMLKNI